MYNTVQGKTSGDKQQHRTLVCG